LRIVDQMRAHPMRIVLALLAAGLTYGVSQTLLVPSLPSIQRSLHTSPAGTTLLFSVFLVAGASTVGIFGRLGDMFGKRIIIQSQLALFSLGALICALVPSLAFLIVGRAFMGCAVGVFPLTFAILRDELPAARVATAIPLIGGMTGVGAAIGQACGGLVTDHLGYHWIFWISLIAGLISIAAIALFVPESRVKSPGRVDVTGAALLAAGLGAPLAAITQAPQWGWGGTRTLALIGGGLALLVVFVWHERRHPRPLLHLPTLMLPRVRLTNLATFLIGFGLFGLAVIIAQFVQVPKSTGWGLGVSATQAGLFFVPGLLLSLVAAPVVGGITRRYGAKMTLIVGTAMGCAGISAVAVSHGHTYELYAWLMILYLGSTFAFGAMPLIILQSVPPELSGQSTSANVILRTAGSSLGVQLAATLVSLTVVRGVPSERGYVHAFVLEASAAFAALLVALAIPAVAGRRRGLDPAVEAVEEARLGSGPV
jgi:MFS family permease